MDKDIKEKDTEKDILRSKTDIRCDVLKVAHHGSSSSSGSDFIYKVRPKYAILSVAADRKLPDGAVIDNLENVGARIYRTDEEGTIVCESDGKNIVIRNAEGEQINAHCSNIG